MRGWNGCSRSRPRAEVVVAAAVGLGVILVVLFLMGRLGTPPLR